MYSIKIDSDAKYFVVTNEETGKSYNCNYSFHKGHGNFNEFYIDVSKVPGVKLKKWFTISQKFIKNEETNKFEPNIFELTIKNSLQGTKSSNKDLTNLF